MDGLCKCGCKQKTNIAKQTDNHRGHIKGQHIAYIRGHNMRGKRPANWKGGKFIDSYGYAFIWNPNHPRANRGYVREHILYAEKVLGKPLPPQAIIHHVNGDKLVHKSNIVICENHAYHRLLHCRQRALRGCGEPTWRRCWICQQWDDPENLYSHSIAGSRHQSCANDYYRDMKRRHMRKYRQRKKEKKQCQKS